MKISIKGVVIIGCIALIWGTLLITLPFSYFSTKKVMLLHTMDIMENISELTLKETQNFFSIARGAANLTKHLISSNVVNANQDHIEKLEKYFFNQLAINFQFAGIYYATPGGAFYYVSRNSSRTPDGYRTKFIENTVQGRQVKVIWRDRDMKIIQEELDPKDTYDPRTRPWFEKAVKEGQVIWTNPYIFFTSQKPGITTAGPIYDAGGKLLGVVGVDIELDVLSKFIGSLRVGKTGMAFLVDRESNVIAYPDPSELKHSDEKGKAAIRLPKLWELSNPVCKKAFDSIEQAKDKTPPQAMIKDSAFAAFHVDDEKYYAMFTPVQESKISWMIGVYIPEKDYFGKIITNQRINLLLILILSCIATIAGLFVAGRIIRPISELDRQALDITNHHYESEKKIKTSLIEIQRTADTFHEMKKAVITYKKELRKEERIHRTITDTANEAILMINENEKVAYWNTAAYHIFGYEKDQVIGKNLFDLVPFMNNQPENGLTLNAVFKNALKNRLLDDTAVVVRHKDGHEFYVEISIVDIKIDRQRHIIAVIHDISQRKKLQEEKIKALKQLQQAQKMEALGLLAGGVAHDLNNVLSGLVSYPELLLMDLPDDSPLRGTVLTIQDSGKKASSIVEDLLALSRRGVTNTQIFNLNTIVNDYLKSVEFKTLHQYHPNLSVHSSLQPELYNMSGTPMHLRKTIMNLMSNAAEAMPQGGSILISTENRHLDAPVQGYDKINPGDYVLLTVQDTGEGIDQDHQKRIFEPFYTTKTMGRSGTGLGMSVIWGAVQDHNGYIHIQSSPENGTMFELYFPAVEKQVEQDTRELSVSDYTGNGESILVIDDVKEQREIARGLLSRLNYEVKTVSSGEKAIEYIRVHQADLVILDMIMESGLDGLDTYRQILKYHPGQKAIITSGFSDNSRVKEAQQLGAGSYIKKPYTLEAIGLAVKKELSKPVV